MMWMENNKPEMRSGCITDDSKGEEADDVKCLMYFLLVNNISFLWPQSMDEYVCGVMTCIKRQINN